ncbi:DUF7507 domain-containing protein [Micrococcoides hystricis]|uniref:SdrD B-like domain-containing protein n=1 Tax=Micrococcoides hystricis TaxID=1572761 RepID=A0ABV6P8U4_9MICC
MTSATTSVLRRITAIFAVLAVFFGMMVSQPPAAEADTGAPGAPGAPQTAKVGDSTVQYELRLVKDGGSGCMITEANGYTTGDNTATDGNICAGDTAVYNISLNVKTAADPVTFTLTPEWLSAEARAAGLPEPNRKPTLKFIPASLGGVSNTVDRNGVITVKAGPNINTTISFELTAETIQSLQLQGGTNPEGAFNLGLKAALEDGAALITAVADKKLNVLIEPRYDQRIIDPESFTNTTTRDGIEYIGISARAGLTTYPGDGTASPAPSGFASTRIGRIFPVDPNTISRYTLQMPANAPFAAHEVLVSYDGSAWKPAQVDAQGNPYVDGVYKNTLPTFRFLIPVAGLPEGKTTFTTRMDVVDEDGNPTRVKDSRGVPSNMPKTAGKEAFGNNTADPGGLTDCSVSTKNEEQGLLAGRYSPNNNCAKQTVNLTKWECKAADGCPSTKVDAGHAHAQTTEGLLARSSANVNLTVTPVDAKDNPTICSVWQPGTQRVIDSGNAYIPTVLAGTHRVEEAFPDAKVYITKADKTNNGAPDCSGNEDWKVFHDGSAGVTGNTFAEPGSMRSTEISGIKIVIPGENVIQQPTVFSYRAKVGDPQIVSTLPTVKAANGNAQYFKTTNYGQVYSGSKKIRDLKDVLLADTPSAGIRDIWGTLDTRRLDTIGKQNYTVTTSGQVEVYNGTLGAVNSTDAAGNPNRVHMRIYLSKCLTADPETLSAGMTYHRGTISNNPRDCGPSTDNYIERTWLLSDQKNETGNPDNDPFFPPNWATENADSTLAAYNPWGRPSTHQAPKFTVVTPAWAAPGQTFDIVHSYRITGTPELDLPAALQKMGRGENQEIKINSSRHAAAFTPVTEEPQKYKPLNSMAGLTTLVVPKVVASGLMKSTGDELVPQNTAFQHSLQLYNYTDAQLGHVQYIDLLPFNGDWRGTKFSGEYWLQTLPEYVGPDGGDTGKIYYTYDDPGTVSLCPTNAAGEEDLNACANFAQRDIDKTPSDTSWKPLTQEVIDEQAKPGVPHITALRFDRPLLEANTSEQYLLNFNPDGNKNADRYVNSTGAATVHAVAGNSAESTGAGALPIPQPAPVVTDVYGALITGNVYSDANKDAAKQGEEKNLSGYTVTLYAVDPDGNFKLDDNGNRIVVDTTATDESGNYAFDSVERGDYRVVVEPFNHTDINTQAGKGTSTEVGSWTSQTISVKALSPSNNGGKQETHSSYDFGVFQPAPNITLAKTVNEKESDEVGLEGSAEFVLSGENTGNVDLEDVKLVDNWVEGKEALELACTITPKNGEDYSGNATEDLLAGKAKLAVGDAYECTGSYTVTQEDLDNQAELPNSAEVTGGYPYTSAITGEDMNEKVLANSKATVTVPKAEPAVTVEKTVDGEKSVQKKAGETATWTIRAQNTGNVTLHNVKLVDTWAGGAVNLTCKSGEEEIDVLGGTATLPVGAEFTCAGESEITQDHVDSEEALPNTVTLTGTTQKGDGEDPGSGQGDVVSAQDTATVAVPVAEPMLSLQKTVTNWSQDADVLTAGDTIEYNFIVTNTGNISIKDTKIDDPQVSNLTCEGDATLAPGESLTCTASHVLTGADVDDGQKTYDNTAVATGATTKGDPLEPVEASATVNVGKPSVSIEKSVDNEGPHAAGAEVKYTFVVTNTGTTPLSGIAVEDTMLEERGAVIAWDPIGIVGVQGGRLMPGESITGSAVVTVTQTDVDAGEIVKNTVSVSASYHDDTTPKDSAEASFTVSEKTGLELVKSVVDWKVGDEPFSAGDTVQYSFAVKNSGDLTINEVQINDPKITEVTCDATSLAPGESTNCTGEYQVTKDDAKVDDAKLENTATASAKSATGTDVTSEESTATVTVGTPTLEITKTVKDSQKSYRAGDSVTYQFTITNTGNTPVNGVVVDDPMLQERNAHVKCDGMSEDGTLSAGESADCEATTVITQDDFDRGQPLINTAKAVGSYHTVTVESSEAAAEVVMGKASPAIQVTKTVNGKSTVKLGAGGTAEFEITVRNTGDVTLTDVVLAENWAKNEALELSCRLGEAASASTLSDDFGAGGKAVLAPGAMVNCIAEYVVTQADVVAQVDLPNSVSVQGSASQVGGSDATITVTDDDTATIQIPAESGAETPGKPDQPESERPGDPRNPGWLPRTGAELTLLTSIGLALAVGGGLLVLGGRRKRRRG